MKILYASALERVTDVAHPRFAPTLEWLGAQALLENGEWVVRIATVRSRSRITNPTIEGEAFMSRVPEIKSEKLTSAQKSIHDQIARTRGGMVAGPFAVWLHAPRIEGANQLGNAIRLEGKLDKRLFEMIVLVTARHWSAQYAWFAHEQAALAAGLAPEIVEVLHNRRVPNFTRDDERVIHEIVTELYESRRLSESSFERARQHFDLDVLIEAITVAGFYTMASMVINAFDAPVPGGQRPLP
jgi:4-carboxymuconolactone decarboxylase